MKKCNGSLDLIHKFKLDGKRSFGVRYLREAFNGIMVSHCCSLNARFICFDQQVVVQPDSEPMPSCVDKSIGDRCHTA